MKQNQHKAGCLCAACLGAVIAAILWITLLMRTQSEIRQILPPLWSYGEMLRGNKKVALESVENVLMFLPLGMMLCAVCKTGFRRTTALVFAATVCIELVQLAFCLGCFEFDDILHNTLGGIIGCRIWTLLRLPQSELSSKRVVVVAVLTAALTLMACYGVEALHRADMRSFAALSDREDSPNLLILNGNSGEVGKTQVKLRYNRDGTITISGKSDVRSWKLLGEQELQPGTYIFTGLRGVAEKTVALELEIYSEEAGAYIRLTQDVGYVEEDRFTLTEAAKIRSYVGVYPGCDCDVIARPALYREEE